MWLLRGLAFAGLLALATASLRGQGTIAPDPQDAVGDVVSAIELQAEKFSCDTAGQTMQDILKAVQAKISSKIEALENTCKGLKDNAFNKMTDQKAAHKASFDKKVKGLLAKDQATLQPLKDFLEKTRTEQQKKVDAATAENVTAWQALKQDRAQVADFVEQRAVAVAKLEATKNRTQHTLQRKMGEVTKDYEEQKGMETEKVELIKNTSAITRAKSFNKCAENKAKNEGDFVKHKQMLDQVSGVVDKLRKCQAGSTASSGGDGAAATALIEAEESATYSTECKQYASELTHTFKEGDASLLLEVVSSSNAEPNAEVKTPRTYDEIVGHVDDKLEKVRINHQNCKDRAGQLYINVTKSATRKMDEVLQKAAAERDAYIAAAVKKKSTEDDAAQAVVAEIDVKISKLQDDVIGGDDGSRLAASLKRKLLADAVQNMDAEVAKAKGALEVAKTELNGKHLVAKKGLKKAWESLDEASQAYYDTVVADIEKSCNVREKTILQKEQIKTQDLEEEFFALLPRIDPNMDKVITTTPKPKPVVPERAKTDGTVVTSFVMIDTTEAIAEGKSTAQACKENDFDPVDLTKALSEDACNLLIRSQGKFIVAVKIKDVSDDKIHLSPNGGKFIAGARPKSVWIRELKTDLNQPGARRCSYGALHDTGYTPAGALKKFGEGTKPYGLCAKK